VNNIKVGIIGFGTVGAGVVSALLENSSIISKRTNINFILHKVADKDINSDRGVVLGKNILTADVDLVIRESDIVVELIGGTTFAKDIIVRALSTGKHVVTANKALIAEYGTELFDLAKQNKSDLYFEAAVAGGIPIIKSLREGFVGNRIDKIYGILNGTCNYILTEMDQNESEFNFALADAQKLGYAEIDPTLDIEGIDTAHKAIILTYLAYGKMLPIQSFHVEGIKDITSNDISYAKELGYKIKLLAIIKNKEGNIDLRVHPAMIHASSIMANINGVNNGVYLEGYPVGSSLFYGQGAGRNATSSAVVADIIDIGLNKIYNAPQRISSSSGSKIAEKYLPISDIETRYYLRMQVEDLPGTMAKITKILSANGISISSILQKEPVGLAKDVPVIIVTHNVLEKFVTNAVNEIEHLDITKCKIKLIRIEDI